jgi:hypothetical protein
MPPKRSPATEASTSARRVTRSQTGQVSVKQLSPAPSSAPSSAVRAKPKSFAQKLAEKVLDQPDKPHVKNPEYQALIQSIVADTNLDRSNKIVKLTKIMKDYTDKPAKKTLPRSPQPVPQTITIDAKTLTGLPRLAIEKIIQHAYRHSIKEQAQMAALYKLSKFEFVPMIQKIKSGIDVAPHDYDQEKIPALLKAYESAIAHATADTNVMNDDTPLGKLRNTSILLRSDIVTVELGLLLESHETFLYKPLDGRVFLDVTVKQARARLQISLCGKLVGKKLVIDDAFNAPGSYSKLPPRYMDHDESDDDESDDDESDDDESEVPNVIVSTTGNINIERASELLSIACKWINKYILSTVEVKAKSRTTGAGAKLFETFITNVSLQR